MISLSSASSSSSIKSFNWTFCESAGFLSALAVSSLDFCSFLGFSSPIVKSWPKFFSSLLMLLWVVIISPSSLLSVLYSTGPLPSFLALASKVFGHQPEAWGLPSSELQVGSSCLSFWASLNSTSAYGTIHFPSSSFFGVQSWSSVDSAAFSDAWDSLMWWSTPKSATG